MKRQATAREVAAVERARAARDRLHQRAPALLSRSASWRRTCSAWWAPTAAASTGSSWPSTTSCRADARPARLSRRQAAASCSPHGIADLIERQGAAVTLTLDRHLQYVAEKALDRAVEDVEGRGGHGGRPRPEDRARSSRSPTTPRFNPNTPEPRASRRLRNRAALDAFEPGSTFKAFVVAAALEEKAIKPSDVFFCENGALDASAAHHQRHPPARLARRRSSILQVSSNIGAAKVAQALGRERLVDYYARFGFGERAGLGLPGEGKGVHPVSQGRDHARHPGLRPGADRHRGPARRRPTGRWPTAAC